eukprot:1140165-Pelagomonas_calceolata.AAC.1
MIFAIPASIATALFYENFTAEIDLGLNTSHIGDSLTTWFYSPDDERGILTILKTVLQGQYFITGVLFQL